MLSAQNPFGIERGIMKIASEVELNKLIKSEKTPNFWLFYGDEGFLKTQYVKDLVSKSLSEEAKQIDYSPFDAPLLVLDELLDCLQSCPFISPRRVAILTGLSPDVMKSEDFDALFSMIKELPSCSLFIVVINDDSTEYEIKKQPRMQKLIALAEKKGVAVYLTARKKSDLLKFVKSELAKYNADADNSVCYKIIDLCRQDMQLIENECAKLGAYATGGMVTQADADFFINLSFEESVFILVENIIAKNNRNAVKKLNDLLENGAKPIEVIATIVSGFTDLQKAVVAQKNGISFPQALTDYGYPHNHTFRLERPWNQANRLRSGYALECLNLALDADKFCKSSKADCETVLVKLVADLCLIPS